MFAIIVFTVFTLFANEGKALEAESICCEEIEALLKNKTTAYQTVCLGPERRLLSNCCRDIEIEVERHRYAHKTLCAVTIGMLRNLLLWFILKYFSFQQEGKSMSKQHTSQLTLVRSITHSILY